MIPRNYPDGAPIPASLPSLYRPSSRCDNCRAYVPPKENVIYFQGETLPYCDAWKEVVRPDYICAVWKPIKE